MKAIFSRPLVRLCRCGIPRVDVGNHRLLPTRFSEWYRGWLYIRKKARAGKLVTQIARDDFKPQAILTVAHGTSWLVAAKVAQRFQLPLHSSFTMIVRIGNRSPWLMNQYLKDFG